MPTTLDLLYGECAGCALPDISHMNHGNTTYVSYGDDTSIVIRRDKEGNETYGRFVEKSPNKGPKLFHALSAKEVCALMEKKKANEKERKLRHKRQLTRK